MNKILLLISFILLFSCSINKRTMKTQNQIMIPAKFSNYNQELNPTGDIILLYQELLPTKQNPSKILQYAVFSKIKKIIVFEDQLVNGKYEWFSDDILKIRYTPGIQREDLTSEGNFYYLNVKTGKKLSNNSIIEKL